MSHFLDCFYQLKNRFFPKKVGGYTPKSPVRLYDGQGNQLRQQTAKGGTVQFNVSNLPYGIYYLHIYDGVNSKPEIQQIMVEH